MAAPNIITTGQRYGRLSVLHKVDRKYWMCRCQCGTTKRVRYDHLTGGRVRSCGCYGREVATNNHLTHGHNRRGATTSTYRVWQGMWSRCTNNSEAAYPNYGGRGIYVCERWISFKNFLEDMGEKPSGLSIDRINNDGPYSPENCRWATRTQQNRNKRGLRLLTHNGKIATIAEWSEITGLSEATISCRLRRKWATEKTLTTPKLQ